MYSFLSTVLAVALGRVFGDLIMAAITSSDFGTNWLIKWSANYSQKFMKQSKLFD